MVKKIAVIGSLNVDFIAYVDHAPIMGETILSSRLRILPGGKGANQAFAIGRMGAPVTMFGAVGKDLNAKIELSSLEGASVDTTNIKIIDELTGMAMITVNSIGQNNIVVSQGANKMVTPAFIDSWMSELDKYDIIVLQLEIPLETVIYATKQLKERGKIIILDPAPAPGRLPDDLLENIDILKPNESELSILTGLTDIKNQLDAGCNMLLEQGVKCVLASLGNDGVMVKRKSEKGLIYIGEDVEAVDTTAAGDSFTAAIAYALANESIIEDAVRFANKVAAIVVQREGAQSSIPTKEEIEAIWQLV